MIVPLAKIDILKRSLTVVLADEEVKLANETINNYYKLFIKNWFSTFRKKLGLLNEENNDKN